MHSHRFKGRSFAAKALCVIVFIMMYSLLFAQVPPPYLHVSFDDGYGVEGKITDVNFNIPYDRVPEENIVPGVRGKGVIPLMDVVAAEKNDFLDRNLEYVRGVAGDIKITFPVPAPEGTVSVWCKPLEWSKLAAEGEKGYGSPEGMVKTPRPYARPRGYAFRLNWEGPSEEYVIMADTHTYWRQGWLVGGKMKYQGGLGKYYRKLWEDNRWRMLTLVYRRGERALYVDDYFVGKLSGVENNPSKPGAFLSIGAGYKVMDELSVWDEPLSAGEVATLYWAGRPRIGAEPAFCRAPEIEQAPLIDGKPYEQPWKSAATITDLCDSYAGSASSPRDSVKLAHKDGVLFVLYREPMPDDYEVAKNILGGTMTSSTVRENDGPVWQDDAVELRLSPDGGKTVYRLICNAAGARFDSRNGDASFDNINWKAANVEDSRFWSMEFSIPLEELSGEKDVKEWGFNIVRCVRQQGFAKRQWCFLPGDVNSLGKILLAERAPDITLKSRWEPGAGQLTLTAEGADARKGTLDYAVIPLIHQKLFPEDEVLNKEIDISEGRQYPKGTAEKKPIGAAPEEISYTAKKPALARVAVAGADGTAQYSHSSLIAAQAAINMIIINLPGADRMLAEIALPSKKMVGSDVSATVTLAPEGAETSFAKKEIKSFRNITGQAEFSVKDLPFGPIEFKAEVTAKGKKIGEVRKGFYHSDKPVWWNKHAGALKQVLKPWKPIVIKGSTTELFIKKYAYDEGLFPSQINILGDNLLAGPMKLVIKSGGKIIDTLGASVTMKNGPGGIRATITAEKSDGKIKIAQNGFVEFDGFIWNEITITPAAEVKIDEIYFEVPIKKEFAKVFNGAPYAEPLFPRWQFAVPAEGMETEPQWCVRIGSVERGIQFAPVCYKYPEEKLVVKDAKPLKIIPSGGAMIYRYTILDTPLARRKPIKLEIGIFGLPARPYDRKQRFTLHGGSGWWNERFVRVKDKGYRNPYYYGVGWTNKPPGSPEDRYYHLSEKNLDRASAIKKKSWDKWGSFSHCYLSPISHYADSREYAYFQDEWRVTPTQAHLDLTDNLDDLKDWNGVDETPMQDEFASICWAAEGVQDYWMYCIEKAMKNFRRHGLPAAVYIDNTGLYKCNNPYHGHGYIDDEGVRRAKHEFLGHRQWTMRLANIIRSVDPEGGHIVVHMSNFRPIGIWSAVDILVEGEQFTAAWSRYIADKPNLTFNDCYPRIMPLERFRSTFAKQLYGVDVAFLSQLWVDRRQKEDEYYKKHGSRTPPPGRRRRYRHLSGLCWVHDSPIWGEIEPIDAWFKLVDWGWDEKVEFIGYWNTRGAYELDAGGEKNIVASVWYRPEGKLAAIIFNDTDEPRRATLRINAEKFPVSLKSFTKAVDASTPDDVLEKDRKESDAFAVRDGVVKVDVKPRDYRFLIFE